MDLVIWIYGLELHFASIQAAGMRFGLLGAGWFGREAHMRNLLAIDDAEIVAVSSRSEASLEAAKILAGDQLMTCHNWRDILKDDSIDAIIVALTNDQHHEAAVAALEAGKHVLCEKPLGLSLAECDSIIAAAEKSGRILQIGHEMRFQRLYQEMKEMIDQGDIGDLQLMWCREFRGPMRPGWRSSEALTGGTILEKNCHHLDLFNWMINRKPVRVMAQGGTNVLTDREILDNAQIMIEYEGGKRATLELCLFAPNGGECEIGACGNLGRIDTKNQALELVHHRFDSDHRSSRAIPDDGDAANFVDSSGRIDRGIGPQLIHFIDSVKSGTPPLNDGISAKQSVLLCLAAQESIKRREAVDLEEFANA
ncbi:MAG: Gfo/Idh/MocA family oxidoreductase [Verrucomicrobiales bacterium]|nr:Gfo/Idh/MocA family oxidoreductase [Verrucomicrobiales bacterium]